jgi:Outer membrane protein beta-barrel domain
MKKHLYLLLFFFAIAFCSQAQVSKGTVLLGGDIGFSSQKTDNPANNPPENKNTTFSVNPSIGRAIKDNLVAGIDLGYTYSKTSQTVNGTSFYNKTNSFGLGIFLREYKPLGKGFSVFTQERIGGSYSKTTDNQSESSKMTGASLTFYPGIAYNIGKRLQVETGFTNLISISYTHSTNPYGYKSDNFSAGTNLSNALDNFVVGCRLLL